MNERREGVTLASGVYQVLREEILNGTLPPGKKLNIREISLRFSTGLSPTREALNRLSSEQLVQLHDNRGFQVSPVSLEELHDLNKARCWANEIGLREAIAHGDAAWEEGLVVALHRLRRAASPADAGTARTREWDIAHRAFHRALIAGCGSTWHINSCERLFDASERYRHLARLAGVRRSDHEAEHIAIMDAALARDSALAVHLITEHFTKTAQLVEQVVRRDLC